jgi:hypothetical protein
MDVHAAAETFRELLYKSHVRARSPTAHGARVCCLVGALAKRIFSACCRVARTRNPKGVFPRACTFPVVPQDGFGVLGPVGNTIYMSPSMRNLTGFEGKAMEGCDRRTEA